MSEIHFDLDQIIFARYTETHGPGTSLIQVLQDLKVGYLIGERV